MQKPSRTKLVNALVFCVCHLGKTESGETSFRKMGISMFQDLQKLKEQWTEEDQFDYLSAK